MITRTMTQTRELVQRGIARREKYPSAMAMAFSVLAFFLSALAVSQIDAGFLLFGWLMLGPLAAAIYVTLDMKGPLVNTYTVVFAVIAGCNFAAYALTRL